MNSKQKLQEESVQLRRIGNRAVRKAQEENRRLGIPNAFSRRGKIYFELPSGRITETNPFDEEKTGYSESLKRGSHQD